MREDIKAYIDGELSPERMEEVRIALESDPALMEEYTAMKNISGMLQSLARQPQVKGVEQTKSALAPQRRFRWREGLAVAATLLLLGVFAAPMILNRSENESVATMAGDDMNGFSDEMKPKRERATPAAEAELFEGSKGVGGGEAWRRGAGSDAGLALEDKAALNIQTPRDEAPAVTGISPEQLTKTLLDSDARQVIKNASFTVQVKSVQDSMAKATQMARSLNGYIESSSVNTPDDDKPAVSGYLTIRVPQAGFEKAIEQVRKYGDVKSENTSGDDVTAQVTDIEARMNTLKAEEDSLRTLLRSASKMGDILDIKDRISQVRQQIESYDSQRRVLQGLASLSTISLTFTTDKDEPVPTPADDDWFEDTKESAIGMLTGIGRFIAQAATFVFILSPVWLPVLLFLLWFKKRAFTTPAREA